MPRSGGNLCRQACTLLLLTILTQFKSVLCARPVHSASMLRGRSPFGSVATTRRGRDAIAAPGALDLATLQRGDLYAVNVHGTSFKLARMDLGLLLERARQEGRLSARAPLTAASLTAAVRAAHPGENTGWAWFADTYSEDGWYRLEIRMDEDAPFPDVVKARAAGYVEGNFQGPHMYRVWTNYRTNEYRGRGEAPSRALYDFFDKQYAWMTKRVQIATGWDLAALRGDAASAAATGTTGAAALGTNTDTTDLNREAEAKAEAEAEVEAEAEADVSGGLSTSDRRYWTLVGLVAAQFEGLTQGFWAAVVDPAANMTWHELYTLNSLGDLYDLNVVFPPSAPEAAGVGAMGAVQQPPRHYTPGHGEVGEYGYGELLDCSAIIKIDDQSGRGDGDGDGDGEEEEEDGGGVGNVRHGTRGDAAHLAAAARKLAAAQRGGRDADSGGGEGVSRGGSRNFWASHNTWRSYYDMVRTWKVYDLPWGATGPLTLSSSPGLLSSKDDWYTTDTFVVMETTNGIYNRALFDLIQPKCVLMWQRVQVANFGAREGSEWVDIFARHNSGTYNNQWMVLNVDELQTPHPRADVLWVLEQVPGTTISRDVTKVLMEQGYWASYNVPYFPEIYNLTGYPHPSIYATCPRARIFSREQSNLTSLSDVMTLMRLNRYETDPLSLGLPNNAIAARYDLPAAPDPSGKPRNYTQRAYGAVDAKIVNLDSFRNRRTYVISGPTSDDQPVFRWSSQPLFDSVRHDGCVDEFDFGWQVYESVVGPPLGPPAADSSADAVVETV